MTIRPHPKWLVVGSLLLIGGWFSLPEPRSTTAFSALIDRLQPQTVLAANEGRSADSLQISQTYAVSPTVIAVEVAAPKVELAQQMPYQAKLGDATTAYPRSVQVKRWGRKLGMLAGDNRETLYGYDRVQGAELNTAAADSPTSYRITSQTDANYSADSSPGAVFRKTKPSNFANQAESGYAWPATHTLFLTLNQPMQPGKNYQLSFPGLNLPATQLNYNPTQTRSEAVHVSQLGFRPDDPVKVGYLSTWMGNGGQLKLLKRSSILAA